MVSPSDDAMPRSCRRLDSAQRSRQGWAVPRRQLVLGVCGSTAATQNWGSAFHDNGSGRQWEVPRRWLGGRTPVCMADWWWWLQQCRSSLQPFIDVVHVCVVILDTDPTRTAIQDADAVRTVILDIVWIYVTILDTDSVNTIILDADPVRSR
jgi:hypothetical protein